MSMLLRDFLDQLVRLTRDESDRIVDADRLAALSSAIERYNRDRPRSDGTAHVVSDSVCTVPPAHQEPLAALAASLLLEQLAAAAINDGDSTIAAESTNRRSKADEYRASARLYAQRYRDAIDAPAPAGAAGTVVAWGQRALARYSSAFERRFVDSAAIVESPSLIAAAASCSSSSEAASAASGSWCAGGTVHTLSLTTCAVPSLRGRSRL
jgi:hypothetical protein